jgi:hypothetical protein
MVRHLVPVIKPKLDATQQSLAQQAGTFFVSNVTLSWNSS